MKLPVIRHLHKNHSVESLEHTLEVLEAFTEHRSCTDEDMDVIGEFITKRPIRILIGREIFLKKYSNFVFKEENDPLKFAKEYGYRLWGKMDSNGETRDDLELRLIFLKEYTRRIETTNLVSNERWNKRMESRGKKIEKMEYGEYFYSTAMAKYYQNGELRKNIATEEDLENDLNSTKKIIWKRMNGIR